MTCLFPGVNKRSVHERQRVRHGSQLPHAHAATVSRALVWASHSLACISRKAGEAVASAGGRAARSAVAALGEGVGGIPRSGNVRPRQARWAHTGTAVRILDCCQVGQSTPADEARARRRRDYALRYNAREEDNMLLRKFVVTRTVPCPLQKLDSAHRAPDTTPVCAQSESRERLARRMLYGIDISTSQSRSCRCRIRIPHYLYIHTSDSTKWMGISTAG